MAFDPLSLSPSWWLDASDTATLTLESGGVAVWADKSGNGRDVRNNTANLRPQHRADHPVAGAKPAVYNTNNSQSLITQNAAGSLVAVPLIELYIVTAFGTGVETTFTTANIGLGGSGPNGSSDGYSALFAGTGNLGLPRMMGNLNSGNFIQSNNFTTGAFVNRDTTVRGSGAGGVPPILPLPLSVLRFTAASQTSVARLIGNQATNSPRAWGGPICEVIGFSTALSATDREQLVTYLMRKWGLEAAGVTGTGSATLAPATGSASGTVTNKATGSATLEPANGSATGALRIQAAGTATLAPAGGAGAATITNEAEGQGTLAPATGSAAAQLIIQGQGAATLSPATGEAYSSAVAGGRGAATLADATGSAAGRVTIRGVGAATLAPAMGAATGDLVDANDGKGSATLAAATGAATGRLTISSRGEATLAPAEGYALGVLTIGGVGNAGLEPATGAAEGQAETSAAAFALLEPATGIATARLIETLTIPPARRYMTSRRMAFSTAARPRGYRVRP